MSLARRLHKAGLVCFFQQLLSERHEARVLHQAPSLRHLSSQRLASFLPRRLQSLGERGVALRQSSRQIPDALSQLLPGRHTVYLVMNPTNDFQHSETTLCPAVLRIIGNYAAGLQTDEAFFGYLAAEWG